MKFTFPLLTTGGPVYVGGVLDVVEEGANVAMEEDDEVVVTIDSEEVELELDEREDL